MQGTSSKAWVDLGLWILDVLASFISPIRDQKSRPPYSCLRDPECLPKLSRSPKMFDLLDFCKRPTSNLAEFERFGFLKFNSNQTYNMKLPKRLLAHHWLFLQYLDFILANHAQHHLQKSEIQFIFVSILIGHNARKNASWIHWSWRR